MTPWGPEDVRWRWIILGALIIFTVALMFGGQAFSQSVGDPRPNMQVFPVVTVDSSGRMVIIGDFANHALRVSVVGGITLGNVTVVSSVLPTGASTDASVQAVETAIRESLAHYGSTFPISGQSVAAVDPSGFTASLSVTNAGALKVAVGVGQNATPTQATICDNFATVTMGWQGGNQQLITGSVGQNIKICSVMLIAASATSLSIIEGSGVLCNTNKAPIFGSITTQNGLNISSTGGVAFGNGSGVIGSTQATGDNVCIANSTSAVVSGGITWTKL